MSEELKACPFCGSLSVREGCDTPDAKWHYVECDDCHATSKADLGVSGAIENWNTRPLEDALRTELDACKSVLADAETQRDMNGAEIDTLLKQLDIAINAIKWCIGFFKDSDHEFDEITKVLLTAHAKIDCIGD